MEFKRNPGHGMGQQITFTNVSLSQSTTASRTTALTNRETGQPIVIQRVGWGSGGGSRTMLFAISGLRPDQAVSFVSAQPDTGQASLESDREMTGQSQISVRYSDDATMMNLTLDVEKIQTVEFLVKPPP